MNPSGSAIYRLILLLVILSIAVLPFIKTTVSVTAAGIVRPVEERTEVKPVLSGTIDSILVKEGETVRKGQLIAVLRNEISQPKQVQQEFEFNQRMLFIRDLELLTTEPDLKKLSLQSPFYRQQLNKVVFELERLEAAIRKVNREQEINQQLIKDKIIAPKEQFDKEIEGETLAATYNAFKNEQLSNWQLELQRYRQENAQYAVHKKQLETETNNHFIYAPVSGVVQNINTRYKGGFISSGETICLLSPIGGLVGECYVTAKDVGLLKVGLPARFQIDAFHYNYFGMLTGKVIYIADDFSIIENRPVFKVRCSFDTTRLVLKNGYSGELKKGLSFQSRFVVAERTLWQLLFDKVDDWLNPTAPVCQKVREDMKRRVKIKQRDISDCGAACLASISIHYKLQYPISRIRQYAGTDKRGTNVLGLIEASERLGFQAKGAKGQLDNLSSIPLPAIAHIILKSGLHHYVVIYKVSKNTVVYMDPGDGEFHKLGFDKFKEIWSGVLVLLLPGTDFVAGKHKISNVQRFWNLINPHISIMLQALIGAVIYTILGLSTSIYMQKIIDFVLVEGNIRLLNLLSIVMIAILLFQLVIGGYKTIFGLQTGQMIDIRLIMGYYKHLLNLPQRFFDTMRVGEIMSRVNDAVKIREFINSVALSFIVNGLIVVFSILLMFFYYWKLALIMLAILPFYLAIYWITNRVNKKWQRRLMEESAELESQMVESLNAVGTIKRFGLERFTNEKTEDRFLTLLQSIYKMSMYSLYIGTGSEFVTRFFTIILLWAGSFFVISNELSTGELLSFYALIGYFTGPASSLITANRSIQDALIAADRLFEIIDLETEATNETKVELSRDQIGDIECNELSFRYGNRTSVFNDLNLRIKKGTSTAIVGESGSGKSTLLSLLQNLYPLQGGTITIGGLDLQYISNRSLRQLVGVVPQQIDLFSGTIIENIAIGDPEPDLGRILFLAKLLGIDEFIEKLPNTYNSIVVEQGTNFSGGQKQRLAIARALYRNPEILILDEATSSLDPASEQKVQETLSWFKAQGKTIIVIAHRLSTIKHCDQILVLNKGKLVEQGNHFELLEEEGHYARLWDYHTTTTLHH